MNTNKSSVKAQGRSRKAVKSVRTEMRGRPVDPNSNRQAQLAKWDKMKAKGVPVHAGRPSVVVKAQLRKLRIAA